MIDMTEVPFIETLVAKESSEDEGNDRSCGDQLQNDGVILQLCKIRCMSTEHISAVI